MKEFDMLCKEFEQMDALSYTAILAEKSAKIIPALSAVAEDGIGGVMLLGTFIMGAAVADGNLSEEEFAVTFPLFHVFFGEQLSYEECKLIVKKMRREGKALKTCVDEMVDLFGQLSEDLKNDVVTVCLMICAIDGKVSPKEKSWIKKLLK